MRIQLIMACLVVLCGMVAAQDTRANLGGTITDTSGAIVSNATVRLTNEATGVTLTTTASDGVYRFAFIDSGQYSLTVSAPGFKTVARSTALRTSEQQTIDIKLEIGSASETVTVTGGAPLLETTNANQGQVIENRVVNSIPLAVGNPSTLMKLAPGATPVDPTILKFDEPAFGQTFGYSFQGSPQGTASFTLDGINNSLAEFGGQFNSSNMQPPVEAVEEFKVSQSYDAWLGHSSGTSVDVTLKQGTNEFHGDVYGFLRSSSLDAMDYFDKQAGNPKPFSSYHRLGFALNGPVYIPKLYDGRNRTFFSYSYERDHEVLNDSPFTDTVPTPAELGGDFSQLLALGPDYQIYDPLTTVSLGNGFYKRSPFPNNIIPADRLNPISLALAKFWPKPNLSGGADGTNNFRAGTASPTYWDSHFIRVDHELNSKQRFFGHYGLLDATSVWANDYNTLATGLWQTIRKQNLGLDYLWAPSSRILFDIRYGYTRAYDPRQNSSKHNYPGNPFGQGFDINTLGLSADLLSQLAPGANDMPSVTFDNYGGLRDNTRDYIDAVDSHAAEAQGELDFGRHTLKFGGEYRLIRYNRHDDVHTVPGYEFSSNYTNSGAADAPNTIGQDLAAFLLGVPTSGLIRRTTSWAASYPSTGFFVQDNWRINSNLTLNLGLRVEHYWPVSERHDRSVRGFAYDTPNPIEAAAQAAYAQNPMPDLPADQFQVLGGALYAGVDGQPSSLYDAPGLMFAPRLAFAYALQKNTVIRGGFAIFGIPIGLDGAGGFAPIPGGFFRTTSLVSSVDNGVSYVASMADPFPGGILSPPGAAAGLSTNLGQSLTFFKTSGLRTPYMERWNLDIEHTLPAHVLFEIAYVGSRGIHLEISDPVAGGTGREIDGLPNKYLSTLPYRDNTNINFLNQQFPNPFEGLVPGSSLNGTVISRQQLLRPYPEFTSLNLGQDDQGSSSYNALQVRLEKRYSKGLMFVGNYTWSKWMQAMDFLNPMDPSPVNTISPSDATHVFSATAVWDLPFGKGKAFAGNPPRIISTLISGWQSSFQWTYTGGFPITFSKDVFTNSGFDSSTLALPSGQRTPDHWFNTSGFVTAPSEQPLYHLRTFPLRFSNLRTAPINSWDISISKETHLTERIKMQCLAQFLNAFNHTALQGVDADPTDGSFGAVTSNTLWPRRIQFGLKVLF